MLPTVSGLLVVNPRSGDEAPSTEELTRVRIAGTARRATIVRQPAVG